MPLSTNTHWRNDLQSSQTNQLFNKINSKNSTVSFLPTTWGNSKQISTLYKLFHKEMAVSKNTQRRKSPNQLTLQQDQLKKPSLLPLTRGDSTQIDTLYKQLSICWILLSFRKNGYTKKEVLFGGKKTLDSFWDILSHMTCFWHSWSAFSYRAVMMGQLYKGKEKKRKKNKQTNSTLSELLKISPYKISHCFSAR